MQPKSDPLRQCFISISYYHQKSNIWHHIHGTGNPTTDFSFEWQCSYRSLQAINCAYCFNWWVWENFMDVIVINTNDKQKINEVLQFDYNSEQHYIRQHQTTTYIIRY